MTAPIRVPTILELFSMSLESTPGTQITSPATTDLMQFLKCDLNPSIENILREDKGLGRSRFGYVAPGKQTAKWSVDAYAILSDTGLAPAFENILIGAMGNPAVVFSDTVQASPSPTSSVFAVGSASTLLPDDIVGVNFGGSTGWEVRPIQSIASNTLTFAVPFSTAPAATNPVQARIYRLSSVINLFTVVDWLRDTTLAVTNISRMAVDAYVDQLSLDCSGNIVTISANGPAAYVVEKQSPASGPYNGTFPTLPSLPTNWTTAYQPETPYLNGEFYLDTTLITAYSAKMMIANGGKQLPVPFGSQFADGVMYGQRDVSIDIEVDGNSNNYAYLLDAEQKNPHAVFFHTGQTLGQFIAVYGPKMVLGLNDIDKNDVTARLNFSSSRAFATAADNEIRVSIL